MEVGVSDGYGSFVCLLPIDASLEEIEATYLKLERKHHEPCDAYGK